MAEVESNGSSAAAKEETNGTAAPEQTAAAKEETAAPEQTAETSALEHKIIKQVEYYFGDINLAKDKFLQGITKESEGWVPMETMLKFNRLNQLSSEAEVIIAALKKSTSGLMEVSEDSTKIRRDPVKSLPELDKDRRDDLKSRTVYIKGFPPTSTIADLETFLETFAPIEHIQLKKDIEKKFKGSVFVLFSNKEGAQKFLTSESVKYKDDGEELIKMLKDDYFKTKNEERKQIREKELKDKEDAKQKLEDEEEKSFESRMTKGAILLLTNVPEIKPEVLKDIFKQHGDCSWIDVDDETKEARVRFAKEGEATTAMEKAKEAGEGKIKVQDNEVEARVLEGAEELDHWKKIFIAVKERNKNKGGKRGRGRHFGSGPQRKRQRRD